MVLYFVVYFDLVAELSHILTYLGLDMVPAATKDSGGRVRSFIWKPSVAYMNAILIK